jgi:DNA-binding NarL/FixJ family response regulator
VTVNLFNNKRDREISLIAEGIRKAFKAVKTELDDHLDAINQNTAETQANQGWLSELDAKINKLSERLDEIELLINPDRARKMDVKLTPREQEVFMALYLSKGLSSSQIAKHLGFTDDMVNMYIFNLMSKGVPVRKELADDVVVFTLDSEFKILQARGNVLEIDSRIASQLAMHNL